MRRLTLVLALAANLYPAGHKYRIDGQIVPESRAAVSLFGAVTPFRVQTSAGSNGKFRFRDLPAGEYTLAVFVPGQGERRQTVEVGPGTADGKGRVTITVQINAQTVSIGSTSRTQTVSARELSIPERARHEFEEAQKELGRRQVDAAVKHLEKAVDIAPLYAPAWNSLGTIAYQSHRLAEAEYRFRKALAADPGSFEPAVNLGGTLLTEGKLDDALKYNLDAVASRPHDALANSQLGLNYYLLGNLDLGEKYLETAEQIDPGHFSYPQLALAQIDLRRNKPEEAAKQLRDFLKRHPDAPEAARVRDILASLKK